MSKRYVVRAVVIEVEETEAIVKTPYGKPDEKKTAKTDHEVVNVITRADEMDEAIHRAIKHLELEMPRPKNAVKIENYVRGQA